MYATRGSWVGMLANGYPFMFDVPIQDFGNELKETGAVDSPL